MAISIANNVRMGMKQDNGDYLIILGILWSDDFDPNSSLKANRGSAWIKTLTFVTDDNNKNNVTNTYVLSIGNKNENYDNIEHEIVKK